MEPNKIYVLKNFVLPMEVKYTSVINEGCTLPTLQNYNVRMVRLPEQYIEWGIIINGVVYFPSRVIVRADIITKKVPLELNFYDKLIETGLDTTIYCHTDIIKRIKKIILPIEHPLTEHKILFNDIGFVKQGAEYDQLIAEQNLVQTKYNASIIQKIDDVNNRLEGMNKKMEENGIKHKQFIHSFEIKILEELSDTKLSDELKQKVISDIFFTNLNDENRIHHNNEVNCPERQCTVI